MELSLLTLCIIICISIQCNAQLETFEDIILTQQPRDPKWGDVSGQYFFQERVTKRRIPLFTRCSTIVYPVPAEHNESVPTKAAPAIRGMEHANMVDKPDTGCGEPDVQLKEGGPYKPNAKIEICSKRGCPLDSIIYFYQLK